MSSLADCSTCYGRRVPFNIVALLRELLSLIMEESDIGALKGCEMPFQSKQHLQAHAGYSIGCKNYLLSFGVGMGVQDCIGSCIIWLSSGCYNRRDRGKQQLAVSWLHSECMVQSKHAVHLQDS